MLSVCKKLPKLVETCRSSGKNNCAEFCGVDLDVGAPKCEDSRSNIRQLYGVWRVTDRQTNKWTDRRTTYFGNTALSTYMHCAVILVNCGTVMTKNFYTVQFNWHTMQTDTRTSSTTTTSHVKLVNQRLLCFILAVFLYFYLHFTSKISQLLFVPKSMHSGPDLLELLSGPPNKPQYGSYPSVLLVRVPNLKTKKRRKPKIGVNVPQK